MFASFVHLHDTTYLHSFSYMIYHMFASFVHLHDTTYLHLSSYMILPVCIFRPAM